MLDALVDVNVSSSMTQGTNSSSGTFPEPSPGFSNGDTIEVKVGYMISIVFSCAASLATFSFVF
jgi:hypothetical protein